MNEFTSSGSKGAASEMYACAHLLSQGYHVFRSVSPACPVDGVAYRDGRLVRFEVKTLSVECAFGWPKNDQWDLLLLVTASGTVHELRPPTTYEAVRDEVREIYGLPSVPPRAKRGTGARGPISEPPRKKVICGTWAGYCRHKSAGTPVCEPCDLTRVRHGEESRKRRAHAANTGHVSERESQ